MFHPALLPPHEVAPDTLALTTHATLPGLGALPVNAFVIRAAEPVLVDTSIASGGEFLKALSQAIDPASIRWIWLTHADLDHVGNLHEVLAAAPQARLVTTYLGMGKLGLLRPVPPERVYLLNPGQELDVGDRKLLAFRPPTFDAPETTGLFDTRTKTLFSSDCFGAVLETPAENAAAIPAARLEEGLGIWASIDAPWLSGLDASVFQRSLERVAELGSDTVLSTHLPPAAAMLPVLLRYLERARLRAPFVGPDQRALTAMLTAA
jgi:hypothetical protein